MCNDCPTNHLLVTAGLPGWLRQLSHWIMTSTIRVFLLTAAALLGTLLLDGTLQVAWEGRPLLDAATILITQLGP